ncbi:MAG: mechanosensitive ion channel [Weeksellaceae bacterium]|nr:mechanosensitive ion channel [Weeksellaceae bacterium]
MDFNITNWDVNQISHLLIAYSLKLVGAILIMVVGFWLAGRLAKLVGRNLRHTGMTLSLQRFLQSLMSMGLKILVLLVAMNTVGFEITALVALLGGLAVGIGMALQGSLSNFAGGILILLFKPFKVGDFIEVMNRAGTVEEITVLNTVLRMPDLRTVILPNGAVFNDAIINFSTFGVRRVEVKIGIGYSDDFDRAKELLINVMKNEPLLLDDREYVVEIDSFGDNSVDLMMFGYTRTANFVRARWNLNAATKRALDEHGFSIPYPQRDLHLVSVPEGFAMSRKSLDEQGNPPVDR